ncbi:MAG: cobalamin B12-binding domain-containing protein [Elusimicrobia bacterium]|nr:cobalamin B12-binding domain-containing protein [Elusimicrobiota bacterium]
MNVLLINPPWITKGGIWQNVASCMPPFGLAAIAAYLEKSDVGVKIIDADARKLTDEEIADVLQIYFAGRRGKPEYVGITSSTPTISSALIVAKIVKNIFPDTKIVLGGVHPSVMAEDVLKEESVDFIVRGEGEETFRELITGVNRKKILGLSYKEDKNIIHNPLRTVISDINTLPFPAYHLLPMEKYFPAKGSYKKLPALGMMTTRGCPGRCTFCLGSYLGQQVRNRSAKKIFEEMFLLQDKYGIKEISFYDDVFTTKKENVKNLCKKIINEKMDISWSCFARVDFVDEELLRAMKDAGCHQIMYGIESGDEQILKNIHKKISLEKVKEVVSITKKNSIDVRAAFMLGNPGETKETMRKTIDYAVNLAPDVAIFNITTPYPGTEMFKWAKDKGILTTENWDEYDLSKPIMDLPTVSAEIIAEYYNLAYKKFYWRLHYLLKRIFRIRSLSDIKVGFSTLWAILKR